MPNRYPGSVSCGYFPVAGVCGRGDRNQNVIKAWLGEDFGSKLLTCCPRAEASRAALWAARKKGSLRGRPGQARNPRSVAITTPHNGWDYRITALGIIVSAVVLTQIPLAHAARRHTSRVHFSRAVPTTLRAVLPQSLVRRRVVVYTAAGSRSRGHQPQVWLVAATSTVAAYSSD